MNFHRSQLKGFSQAEASSRALSFVSLLVWIYNYSQDIVGFVMFTLRVESKGLWYPPVTNTLSFSGVLRQR